MVAMQTTCRWYVIVGGDEGLNLRWKWNNYMNRAWDKPQTGKYSIDNISLYIIRYPSQNEFVVYVKRTVNFLAAHARCTRENCLFRRVALCEFTRFSFRVVLPEFQEKQRLFHSVNHLQNPWPSASTCRSPCSYIQWEISTSKQIVTSEIRKMIVS